MLHRRTITLLTSLFFLILCFNAMADTSDLPSVCFAATQYEITEHYTDAWFQLIITDPPDVAFPVWFYVSGGTATEWEDFDADENAAWFYPEGSDTISWYVQIWEDEFVEGPETIELTLNEGGIDYVVGSPNTTTITILDDDTLGPPTVRFGSTQFSITEGLTEVLIPVIRSGELVQDYTQVGISITEGTAVAGTDYEMVTDAYAQFRFFESDTSYAHFLIYEDEDPEDPETIFLAINDGGEAYSVGSPNAATLMIIDDDSDTPTAHFEIAEDVPLAPDGSLVLVSSPEVEITVDVVVDDLPPGGAIIHFTSSADGLIHSLEFGSNPRQTIVVPAVEIPEESAYAINTLEILNPVGKRSTSGSRLKSVGIRPCVESLPLCLCAFCIIEMINVGMGNLECEDAFCDVVCPPENIFHILDRPKNNPEIRDIPTDVETLQRYRDEVLLGAPGGDYYIQLYQDFSPAIANAILQRPTLIYRVMNTWDLWLPAVAAQVDGQGAIFTITGEMQAALLNIMSEFEEVGSSELAQLVAEFRVELDLENIAGTTAADLQTAIETNPMETERSTWGGVKALYRDRE